MTKVLSILLFFQLLFLKIGYSQDHIFDWVNQFSGSSNVGSRTVAIDVDDNVYSVGYFSGKVDFDPSVVERDTFYLTSRGGVDVFINKTNSEGELIWAKSIGGSGGENAYALVLDSASNVYLAGTFNSTADFDPSESESQNATSNGDLDFFVLKLDESGAYQWHYTTGGTGLDNVRGMAVNDNGEVVFTGRYRNTVDFDTDAIDADSRTSEGDDDIYIEKLDSDGNHVWVRTFGWPFSFDWGLNVEMDASNNVYATGAFSGRIDFNPGSGTHELISNGSLDAYILKLDEDGDFLWANSYGNSGFDLPNATTIDKMGNLYVAGFFGGTVDFDPSSSTTSKSSNDGSRDIYIAKYSSEGVFQWVNAVGSEETDEPLSVALDDSLNVFLVGYYGDNTDFDPSGGTDIKNHVLKDDIFIQKMDSAGGYKWTKTFGTNDDERALGVVVDSKYNVYVTGYFPLTLDFDPASAVHRLSSAGGVDAYVLKLTPCIQNTVIDTQVCDSYITRDNQREIRETGVYTETLTNIFGCDSIISVNLDIKKSTSGVLVTSSCVSYYIPSQDTTFYRSGIYSDTIPNAIGCDSVLTVFLTIEEHPRKREYHTVCDSFSSYSGSSVWKSSGVYEDVLASREVCDSIITFHLEINYSSIVNLTESKCDEYLAPDGVFYTESGNYQSLLESTKGCDSLLSIDLTISTLDSSVSVTDSSIRVLQSGYQYQWLDCNNGDTLVLTERNQEYVPSETGTYAVKVMNEECLFVSDCFDFTLTNTVSSELKEYGIAVHPNPANKVVFIQDQFNIIQSIHVFDLDGKNRLTIDASSFQNRINVSDLPSGIFLLVFSTSRGKVYSRLIKE